MLQLGLNPKKNLDLQCLSLILFQFCEIEGKLIRHETGDARNELDRPRRDKESSAKFHLERLLTINSCLIIGIVERNSKEKIINMERRQGTQNIT